MSVAARALSIAARAKPSIGGALILAAIASVPWVERHQHRDEAPIVTAAGSPEIEPDPAAPIILSLDQSSVDVIAPPNLRDARPYPEGMVMGMGAPSVDPGIVQWDGSPLANVLSVILAPWRALAGLRGT